MNKEEKTNFSDNFKKGTSEMLVLHLLCKDRKYGYQIIQELASLSDGTFLMQEGSLYPNLYRLESGGYVEKEVVISEETGRLRKYYTATPKGHDYLKRLEADYRAISGGVAKVLSSD